jgi:3-hydroxy-9,10-secoandrosta-1,3,5(10)-triene-9,17-dione monooxygenase reductase component
VLFCAAHSSRTYPHIQRAGAFAINILSRTQEEVSKTFARKEEDDRFAEVGIETDVTGAPILSDSIAYLDCRMVDRIEHGDHDIVLGEVTAAGVQPGDSEPLLFFRGSYRRPAES